MKYPNVPGKTTPAFAFSVARRALLNGIAVCRFGETEMEEVMAYFDHPKTCVFCGKRPIQRWDHLVAISNGGDTVLGNMAPTCARCDDSKGASPYRDWALGDAKHSPKKQRVPDIEERLNGIDDYVKKYRYHPQLPVDRLIQNDFDQFKNLEKEREDLHKRFDAFIEHCQRCVGGK